MALDYLYTCDMCNTRIPSDPELGAEPVIMGHIWIRNMKILVTAQLEHNCDYPIHVCVPCFKKGFVEEVR